MITKEQAFGMYIGQRVIYTDKSFGMPILSARMLNLWANDDGFQLILRPFSSMTDEEHLKYVSLWLEDGCVNDNTPRRMQFNSVEYLISIGIDVFNLKDRGWAVYESELKGENNE